MRTSLTCLEPECIRATKLPDVNDLPGAHAPRWVVTRGDGEAGVPDSELSLSASQDVLLVRNGNVQDQLCSEGGGDR